MSMQQVAQDALDADIVIVEPTLAVDALAEKLEAARVPGAVVVAEGRVVGVVTEMDLVYRNKRVHLPTMIAIFDALIPFDPGGRTKAELEKATGATVGQIMSEEVVSAEPSTKLADVAAWMVDQNLSLVPVLGRGRLVGVVSRRSMMRAAFEHR